MSMFESFWGKKSSSKKEASEVVPPDPSSKFTLSHLRWVVILLLDFIIVLLTFFMCHSFSICRVAYQNHFVLLIDIRCYLLSFIFIFPIM